MKKVTALIALVGGLIAAGIVLSFYGSQIITEDLSQKDAMVRAGDSLEITSDLDFDATNTGVYVVQIQNFEEGAIYAKVFDPLGTEIVSSAIDKESFEERFGITLGGTYRLLIENRGQDDAQIIGVIGPMPDPSKLSLGLTGFYILVVGLIGIVGVGIYAVRNRHKD